MSNMQTFHKWLFSTATHKPGAYQRRLALLTRISRPQILSITSDMTWVIWESDQPATA